MLVQRFNRYAFLRLVRTVTYMYIVHIYYVVLSGVVKSFTAEMGGGKNGLGMFARLFQQSKYLLSLNLVNVLCSRYGGGGGRVFVQFLYEIFQLYLYKCFHCFLQHRNMQEMDFVS
jgi:hypothetical protein